MIPGTLALICLAVLIWTGWPRGIAARAGFGFDAGGPTKRMLEPGDIVRIATYNIHGGRDDHGHDNLDRVATDVAAADIVAFQETRGRGFRGSQAGRLAELLGGGLLLAATRRAWFRLDRANALVSRLPLGAWQHAPLPHQSGKHRHFRSLTRCTVEGAGKLTVLFTHTNTHKGADNPGGRDDQLRALADAVLAHRPCLLLGDLNADTSNPVLQDLLRHDNVTDVIAQAAQGDHRDRKDWIIAHGVDVLAAGYHESGASDHPAYWCEVRVPDPATAGTVPADLRQMRRLARAARPLAGFGLARDNWPAVLRPTLILIALISVSLGGLTAPWWLLGAGMIGASACWNGRASGRVQRRIADATGALGWGIVSGTLWLALLAPVLTLLITRGSATPTAKLSSVDGAPVIHRDLPTLLRSLAPLLLIPVAGDLAVRGLAALTDPGVTHALLMSCTLGLVALARVLERHHRDQRIVLSPLYQDLRIRLAVISLVGLAGVAHLALETEFLNWTTHWLPGLALLLGAAWLLRQASRRVFLIEGLLVAAVALLVEVEWLVPLLVPFYVALALDAPRTRKRRGPTRPLSAQLFTGITAVALTAATMLEAAAAL